MRITKPLIAPLFVVIVVILAVLLQPITAMSQEKQYWIQTVPLTRATGAMMVKDAAANLYIATNTTNTGAPLYSFFLVKYNGGGTEQWTTSYTSANITSVIGIGVDNAQNVYVGIDTKSGIAVIKYGSVGQLLWISTLYYNHGTPYGSAITVDAAGNCYLTGYTTSESPQTLTFKMNSAGVQEWVASYVGSAGLGDNGEAITIDGPGNVYVAGTSQGIGTNADIVTIKYGPNGSMLWAARYIGSQALSEDNAIGITVDTVSGNVYTVGQSQMNSSDIGDIIAYSSAGTQLWANQDNSSTANLQVLVDYAGNVITLGDPAVSIVFTATEYTAAGSILWTNGFSPSSTVSIQQFAGALDNSGNLYVTMPIGISNVDYSTVEYYSDGTLAWSLSYDGPAHGWDNPYAIAIQNPVRRGIDFIQFPEIFVTGTGDNFTDLTTIMYSRPPITRLSTAADSLTANAAILTTPIAQLSNYPNPFRGATTIAYTIPGDSHVTLTVYDGAGRPVATLVDEAETAGPHQVPFNAGKLAAGSYAYRIVALSPQGTFTQTKQMIIE